PAILPPRFFRDPHARSRASCRRTLARRLSQARGPRDRGGAATTPVRHLIKNPAQRPAMAAAPGEPRAGSAPARGGGRYLLCPFIFSFAAAHSFLLISRKPWPLQEFWPLQALWALLQADWPLQAFTPAHWVLASVPATAVLIRPVPKSMAAAVATARPELFFNCIVHSSCCEDLAG